MSNKNNHTGATHSTGAGLQSRVGETRDGQPLSLNRAPAEHLRPFVSRIYATRATANDGEGTECSICSDLPVMRFILEGKWTGHAASGPFRHQRAMLFNGPHSKQMPVEVDGGFATVTVVFQPGAMEALGGPQIAPLVDEIVTLDQVWPETDPGWLDDFPLDSSPFDWLQTMEQCLTNMVEQSGPGPVSEITRDFDHECLIDPNLRISEFAERHEVTTRTVTRTINRDFGMPPKKVLQRARALDLAATLRGIVEPEERENAALRYYDQSHMIREFAKIFETTPHAFKREPKPILTLTLETRQARRLEVLRKDHGQRLPSWRNPRTEPKPPQTNRTVS